MKKSGPANNAMWEISRIDGLIRDFVRSRKVITLEDIREFRWLKQCRRNEVSVIENSAQKGFPFPW